MEYCQLKPPNSHSPPLSLPPTGAGEVEKKILATAIFYLEDVLVDLW